MKTNQLMKRKMGEFNVTQRTKDGFFLRHRAVEAME